MSYNTSLERCRELIEKKLGWPPADEWRDFEFNELSEKIYDATSVRLSSTTLKRVFGKVKYENLPSSSTLNTLSRFLGYQTWMDFQSATQTATSKEIKHFSFSRKWIAVAGIVVIIVVSSFILISGSSNSAIVSKNVVFKSKPLAKGLPNSVVFNIDLGNDPSKDILIQQSWDSTKTVRIQKGQKEATAIYYIPGYFRAKLIVDKRIVKEHDLFIQSDGWMATLEKDPEPPLYVPKEDIKMDHGLSVSETIMDKIRHSDKPMNLVYHLVQPFPGLNSDDFSLETAFRNTYGDDYAVCKTAKVFILCTNGAFIIPFTIPGCISDINLKLGDVTWNGKTNDLSAFAIDPSQTIHLRIEVKQRNVKIYCNDKLIREAVYNETAGDIAGFRYLFNGAGKVDYIKVIDGNGNIAYQN